jgi:hypothetical protein
MKFSVIKIWKEEMLVTIMLTFKASDHTKPVILSLAWYECEASSHDMGLCVCE